MEKMNVPGFKISGSELSINSHRFTIQLYSQNQGG